MLNLTDIQPQADEIYLDNNATTPVLPQAAEAAIHTMNLCYGNPSSSHMTGLKAKYILESTRMLARQVIGADSGDIIFTSGATEGIQTSIISALNACREKAKTIANPVLLYGATEHKAVPETLKHWNAMLNIDAKVLAIPVDERGILDYQFIARHASDALMICTMVANNETGVFQDLKALEQVIRDNNPGVLWMVDCVQGLGKISLDIAKTSIDYAPFSGHKLYGPKGIGMLYVRHGSPYTPIIAGGGQESGLRSGTENLPGIASLNAIFKLLNDEQDDTFKSHDVLCGYRQQLADTLNKAFENIVYNHDFDCSLPTTLNFSVKGLSSKDIMDLFDAARIRVSSGSACSSKVTGSFVLDAMGKPKWQSEGAIRLSFGPASTQEEIDRACIAIEDAVVAMQHHCLLLTDANGESDADVDGLQQWGYDNQVTWCYVSQASRQILLIDPVAELSERFQTLVNCRQFEVVGVLNTHLHQDQEDCSQMLRSLMHDAMQQTIVDNLGWPETHGQVTLENGQTVSAIEVGDKVLANLPLPGHTENSRAYLLGKPADGVLKKENIDYVFAGDLIQIGGIGRSDLHGSMPEHLFDSIRLLAEVVTPDTLLCPAHDYQQLFSTTLALEANANPLLAKLLADEVSKTEFIEQKAQLDAQILQAGEQQLCGLIAQQNSTLIDVFPDKLQNFLADNPDVQVVDVREPHEFEAHRREYLDDQKIVNIPLTRITDFIHRFNGEKADTKFICICRSGSRSAAAANALKRLDFEHVYHVPGGFALVN
ncbi:aminotransferase class V-fold PLP-dependent enzyme [Thalassotalea sp. PS06]|uniref:aminotransferase class V-fold PLP-dependent enzyme n=1 Tax=Thalassotalea sp. PS06 TaxID=2594005 RepID=UPI0011621AA6|nr:aminotransferase class V-fold PLP-dependent enzyme [Thalassotalea sp. PS06]QDP02236.1 aminotransferase class V-fold PLP-dependent enzyme [Thalassotalea sp. PS06]